MPNIIITGASDGIGAELARQLARRHGLQAMLVLAARNAAGLQAGMAEITYRPEVTIDLNDDDRIKMQKIIDALEELDDVQEVFHNAAL